MDITVLTLFPEIIDAVLGKSIIGRAVDAGILNIRSVDIRDFSQNKYGKVDDTLYGGGTGMLMMCQPVFNAWQSAIGPDRSSSGRRPKTIHMSPKGKVFNQKMAVELAREESLIILCGHYEGIDQRVLDEIVDEEISIGDYVITGGEIAACAIVDAIARLIPGVLPDEDAYSNESHMNYALEHPQYTKPAVWNGKEVPAVLLSGHHKNIADWKRIAGLYDTMLKRPDLFDKMDISESDLIELIRLGSLDQRYRIDL
ncbi:MAG: tRNA (guanosine(37)-N1)-methyltransferase TrmD [Saccharofermentanales bacterium]